MTAGETIEDAFHTYQIGKEALAELIKWVSNSQELDDKIPSELGQTGALHYTKNWCQVLINFLSQPI